MKGRKSSTHVHLCGLLATRSWSPFLRGLYSRFHVCVSELSYKEFAFLRRRRKLKGSHLRGVLLKIVTTQYAALSREGAVTFLVYILSYRYRGVSIILVFV